jgi:hypothetical protein
VNVRKVTLSPLIDVSYKFHYTDGMEFMRYAKLWYGGCYGTTLGETYADKATLSSGIFAVHKDNSILELWGKELAHICSKKFNSHSISHLAEDGAKFSGLQF